MPSRDLLVSRFDHLFELLNLSIVLLGIMLSCFHRFHCGLYLGHGADDRLQIVVVEGHVLEAASDKFAHSDEFLDLQARDRLVKAVEL